MVRVRATLIVFVLYLGGPLVHDAVASKVGELVAAAEQAATAAALSTRDPEAAQSLISALQTLRTADVLDEDIATFVKRFISPDAWALAHRRPDRYRTEIKTAIDTIKGVANSILAPAGALTPDLRSAVLELQTAEQTEGLTWDLETLRRLERKFGPGSAKLNGIEVLLAYGLQRLPAFGIDSGGRPGPLEAVTAYSPSYISRSDDKMRLVGVAEIGLRQYFFARSWGSGSGPTSWLRPRYMSYGVAWAGGSDDPLTPPWKGESRLGAFLGWGQLKVAWLAGDDQRVLVTQQFQLIPWVF